MKELQEQLADARSEREKRQEELARIKGQIQSAERVLAEAETLRREHAHGAAIGQADDAAALKKSRQRLLAAQAELDDLQAALPEAHCRLTEVQLREQSITRAIGDVEAQRLYRARVTAGARVDRAAAELQAAVDEYTELGETAAEAFFEKMAARGYGGVTVSESLYGMRRVHAAMPLRLLARLFPDKPLPAPMKLQFSEASFFGISPEIRSEPVPNEPKE